MQNGQQLPDIPAAGQPTPGALSSVDAAAAFMAYSDGITEKISGLVAVVASEQEALRAKADRLRDLVSAAAAQFAKDMQAHLDKVHALDRTLDAEHERIAK